MKKNRQHAPVMIMHKKLTMIYYDLYELQSINLNATHRYLEQFKETEHF